MEEEQVQAIADLALKIGSKIIRAIYMLVVLAIVSAFGTGVFFSRVDARLGNLDSDIRTIAATLTHYEPRIRSLEMFKAQCQERHKAEDRQL